MPSIVRSISFSLVQAIYPLIPDLYGVFQDLAANRYFSQDAIRTLSGNIYIVISVCMLFSLGLKLLSAIVNPEVLTDQKKGVKSVAMHIIFAVFLIALIPIGFNYLYEFQDDMVSNQLVEKIVLGMDTSDKSKPGQILAAYTFASFCAPSETVSSEALDSNGSDYYNKAISEDIDNIKKMDGVINKKTDGEWDMEYNPIIAPAVGFYVVYQLVILCMDMALRTIKLGLLELITPIILCGYVIVGTEILQKWAKMVFTTFVLLFLKVAMVSFMVYALSLLPDFLSNFSDKGFFYRGFLRVFMIIGLLQLIKQVPDIINNIFGSNIKSRGGIRGRLGEMAAVGELAQKGWDKIRTGAAAIGTKAAIAAGAISSGPIGWAAMGGAAAIHHGWKRGFGGGKPWRETDTGRGLRKFGAGAKAVGTGLTTKGGIIAGTKAGIKSYEDSGITKDPNLINDLKGRIKRAHGIGEDGRLSAVTDVDRLHVGLTDAEKNPMKTRAARAEEARIAETRDKELKGKLQNVAGDVEQTQYAARNKAIASAAKGKYDSLVKTLDDIIANTTDDSISKAVGKLRGSFVTGKASSQKTFASLRDLLGADDGDVKKFKSDAEKFERLLMNDYLGKDGNAEMTMGQRFLRTDSGGFNISTLGQEMTAIDSIYDNRKGDLDKAVEFNKFNDSQKAVVDSLLSNADVTYKAIADTSATWFNGNGAGGAESFFDGIMLADVANAAAPTPTPTPTPAPAPTPAAQNANSNQSAASNSGGTDQQSTDSQANSTQDNNQTSSDTGSNVVRSRGGDTTTAVISEPVTANVDLSGLNESLNNINKSIDNASNNITSGIKDQTTTLSNNMTTERKLQSKEFNKTINNLSDSINKKDKE